MSRRVNRGAGRRRFLKLAGGAVAAVLVGGAGYAGARFEANRGAAAATEGERFPKLADIGTVGRLSILPLIEYFPARAGLAGEPGVSYLVRADETTILFDVGFNEKRENPSPLLRNAAALDVDLGRIDGLVISHPHNDHIGGAIGKVSLTAGPAPFDLRGIPAYLPASIDCPTTRPVVVTEPRSIARGVATMGPLVSPDFIFGLTHEQSLAVNVAGKGIVLIVGCGHPGIERTMARAEMLFDEPIHGIVGGLHFPVTGSRMQAFGLPAQQIVGTGKWPGQRIDEADVRTAIAAVERRSPKLVALSAHDSCDWSIAAFRESFGERSRDVKVGQEIAI